MNGAASSTLSYGPEVETGLASSQPPSTDARRPAMSHVTTKDETRIFYNPLVDRAPARGHPSRRHAAAGAL